ncbi:MAG: cation transporter [bacterium]|nr:cation transporter [bacterium]
MNSIQLKKDLEEVRHVRRITWIGIAVNLALAALKGAAGILGGSQAVIADAFHSLSDSTTDVAILLGVKFWSAPPDECHPYGHKRIETLITTSIGFLLAAVAVAISYNALNSVREVHMARVGWIAVTGPLLSIIVKEILYRKTIKVGIEIKSRAVMANAWHHRSDALSSIPALLAVAASVINPKWAFVDSIGALVVSLFILKVAWDITRPALSELTDSGASRQDRKRIHEIAVAVEGVKEAHAIRTRKAGPSIYVDLHILVEPEMTVREGHDISEAVREKLVNEGPEILDVVVHLEPYEREKESKK